MSNGYHSTVIEFEPLIMDSIDDDDGLWTLDWMKINTMQGKERKGETFPILIFNNSEPNDHEHVSQSRAYSYTQFI